MHVSARAITAVVGGPYKLVYQTRYIFGETAPARRGGPVIEFQNRLLFLSTPHAAPLHAEQLDTPTRPLRHTHTHKYIVKKKGLNYYCIVERIVVCRVPALVLAGHYYITIHAAANNVICRFTVTFAKQTMINTKQHWNCIRYNTILVLTLKVVDINQY